MFMSRQIFTRVTRSFHSSGKRLVKIPKEPTWKIEDQGKYKVDDVDRELVQHLERLALVDFENKEGVERLKAAVHMANQLLDVNTDGVEPMDTVLEDMPLYLREDKVTEGNQRDEVLQNASKTLENYYVAPPGNIPLDTKDKDYG